MKIKKFVRLIGGSFYLLGIGRLDITLLLGGDLWRCGYLIVFAGQFRTWDDYHQRRDRIAVELTLFNLTIGLTWHRKNAGSGWGYNPQPPKLGFGWRLLTREDTIESTDQIQLFGERVWSKLDYTDARRLFGTKWNPESPVCLMPMRRMRWWRALFHSTVGEIHMDEKRI
jgi:hypothetical protein